MRRSPKQRTPIRLPATRSSRLSPTGRLREPDWEFFLPDDEETYPEPGDFWIEEPDDEDP